MAQYVAVDKQQLEADLTTVADAIREKAGTTEPLAFPQGMADAARGIGSNVGNLTKYERLLLIPKASAVFEFANPLGIKPKYIFIEAPEGSKPFTDRGYVRKAVITFANGLSVASGINASTGNTTIAPLSETQNENTESVSVFYANEEKIKIPRVQANVGWSYETEYIIDIYA